MKTLYYSIIVTSFALVLILPSTTFSQSFDTTMQNVTSPTYFKCVDSMTQNMKTKYASFDEERAKTAAINYDKFKSEVKDDKYTFRAVSQEWTNDQVKCDATFKNALVLFFVTDTLGKQRDVTVLIDPVSYEPEGIDVKYDPPTHGGVGSILTNQDPDFNLLYLKSPLKQFKSGFKAEDVKCKQDLQLVIKAEDGSPACVKSSSVQKLVDWGWALTRLSVDGLKETYSIGEKINFTINFQGLKHYCDYPHISISDSNQNVMWKSKDIVSMCISTPFSPLPYVNQRFDLNSTYSEPIVINELGNYTLKVSLYGVSIEKIFTVIANQTSLNQNSKITHMELKAYGFVCCGLDGDLLKGNLTSNMGPIPNANVAISINGIPMGYAKTYPDGCFQFNQWNDSKLSEQTNEFLTNEKNSGSYGPFKLAFSAIYAGDDDNHYPANANATSSMSLIALPLPPSPFETTITPSQVNVTQRSSSNFQISVKPMIEPWSVIHMSLYLEGLPCEINYQISQASDNDTSSTKHPAIFDINLNTRTYSPGGMYFVHIMQNGTNPLTDHEIGTFSLNILKMR